LVYGLLLSIKVVSRIFYRFDIRWIGPAPAAAWSDLRLVVFLNHTSLYEPLFVGWFPNHFLKKIAWHGLMPVADKALRRPVMGHFFKLVAHNVVSITRLNDYTWQTVIDQTTPDTMVVIMPEGRMMRKNGLDKYGWPMTVRGGVADLLMVIPHGRMLLTYSGGMHHVQAPGEPLPRVFKTLRMRLETVDIEAYRNAMLARAGRQDFKRAVARDLEMRRDRYCPFERANPAAQNYRPGVCTRPAIVSPASTCRLNDLNTG
jgi:1-acyl-sn-glycerol-3-phosphate acyltransferase